MSTLTDAVPARAERSYPDYGRPAWRRWLLNRETAIIALLLVTVVAASVLVPKFATPITMGYLLLDATPVLLIALAMAPVMIAGDIVEIFLGVKAEGQSLEDIAQPLTAEDQPSEGQQTERSHA